jgi:hypothetical protein
MTNTADMFPTAYTTRNPTTGERTEFTSFRRALNHIRTRVGQTIRVGDRRVAKSLPVVVYTGFASHCANNGRRGWVDAVGIAPLCDATAAEVRQMLPNWRTG